jgi:undecaprenyl-diphosphatase
MVVAMLKLLTAVRIGGFIVCIALFGAIAAGVAGGGALAELDAQVATWLPTRASTELKGFMSSVSALHRPRAILAWTAVVALVLLWRRDGAAQRLLWLTVLGGATLNHLLKHSFRRPRPGDTEALAAATDFSFPSGHVANASLLWGAVAAIIVCRLRTAGPKAGAVLGAAMLVALVACSRLVLGAHHLSDVVAGAILGLGWLLLCLSVVDFGGRGGAAS